jgi:hypothetical protein
MIRFAALLAALLVVLPVEAMPVSQRRTVKDKEEANPARANGSHLCFVETGKGEAKRRTPYILDFDNQCPATDSAAHHEKKLRNHRSS